MPVGQRARGGHVQVARAPKLAIVLDTRAQHARAAALNTASCDRGIAPRSDAAAVGQSAADCNGGIVATTKAAAIEERTSLYSQIDGRVNTAATPIGQGVGYAELHARLCRLDAAMSVLQRVGL